LFSISLGSGADFNVGTIGETEVIFIGTDLINSNNQNTLNYSRNVLTVGSTAGLSIGNYVYQEYNKISFDPSTDLNSTTGVITLPSTASDKFIAGDIVKYDVAAGNTAINHMVANDFYYVVTSNSTSVTLSYPWKKAVTLNNANYPNFANNTVSETGHYLYKVAYGTVYGNTGSIKVKSTLNNFGVTGAQAGEKIYYFDDMEFDTSGSGGTGTTPQTITFDAVSDKTLGGSPFTLTATASSGLNVSFTTAGDKVTINGNTVTLVKAGRTSITANQAGDNTFAAATPVERSFCIKPAKPTITISNDNSEAVTLSSSAASGNQWLLNGQNISGQTGTSITVTDPGSYSVLVQVDDCKSDNADAVPLVVTGDLNKSEQVVIYPNPSSDVVYIRGVEGNLNQIFVRDALGRQMNIATAERSADTIAVSVTSFSPGTYFMTLKTEKGIYRVRFIRTDR